MVTSIVAIVDRLKFFETLDYNHLIKSPQLTCRQFHMNRSILAQCLLNAISSLPLYSLPYLITIKPKVFFKDIKYTNIESNY